MNKKYMATILAFKDVTFIPGVCITMGTTNERAILVQSNGNTIKFNKCDDALYFLVKSVGSAHDLGLGSLVDWGIGSRK